MEHIKLHEAAAAGCALSGEGTLAAMRKILRPDDFSGTYCSAVFKAACTLADAGKLVDPVSVQAEARAMGIEIPDSALLQMMETVPSLANAERYAELVREASIRRSVMEAADKIGAEASDGSVSVAALLSDSLERLQAVTASSRSGILTPDQLASNFLDFRDKLERGEIIPAVSTGYGKLDKILGGGFLKSGLYILAARPGVGKTTLGLQIADRVARSVPVLFISLEMDEGQLSVRRAAEQSAIPSTKIANEPHITDADRDKLASAAASMGSSGLHLNEAASMTVEDIALLARSVPNLGLLVIDYLGLIQSKEKGSLYERVTANSNALKRLARSLKIPVLCLAQLNRESEHRKGAPMVSDLRDSGAIEQDADGILLLSREDSTPDANGNSNPADCLRFAVDVAKNRHGRTGCAYLNFYPRNGRIRE